MKKIKSKDDSVIRPSMGGGGGDYRVENGEREIEERGEGEIILDSGEGIKIVFPFLCTLENGHLKLCGWSVPEGD